MILSHLNLCQRYLQQESLKESRERGDIIFQHLSAPSLAIVLLLVMVIFTVNTSGFRIVMEQLSGDL